MALLEQVNETQDAIAHGDWVRSDQAVKAGRYAHCITASKQARWGIDHDVIRWRRFDVGQKFLPDGLSVAEEFRFLSKTEKL